MINSDYHPKDLPKELLKNLLDLWDRLFLLRVKINEESFSNEPPNNKKLVFHYTSPATFKKIIESKTIWLSDLLYTNDPSEILHNLDIAKDLLKKGSINKSPTHYDFAKFFLEKINKEHISNIGRSLAFCASLKSDDLDQWRAYAADGRGFALGFDWSLLEQGLANKVTKIGRSFHSALVKYDDRLFREIFTRIWDEVDRYICPDNFINYTDSEQAQYLRFLSGVVAMFIVSFGLFGKHTSYSSEQEYRFLVYQRRKQNRTSDSSEDSDSAIKEIYDFLEDDLEIKYHDRNGVLVPYFQVAFPTDVLKEIKIGPSSSNDEQTIKSFIKSFGFSEDIVKKSAIPYRSKFF